MAAASPVSASAWQRQPPESRASKAQEAQGSRIQAVPRQVATPLTAAIVLPVKKL